MRWQRNRFGLAITIRARTAWLQFIREHEGYVTGDWVHEQFAHSVNRLQVVRLSNWRCLNGADATVAAIDVIVVEIHDV